MLKKSEISTVTVVDEDFSNFTKGSESEPDPNNICAEDWSIPDSYFKQPGWTGSYVTQAGGAAFVSWGCLNTPQGDYSGTITVTFKAKAADSNSSDKVRLNVGVLFDIEAGTQIGWDSYDVEKGDWKEYKLVVNSTYGGTDAFVQFNTWSDVLIDDVKVTKQQNYIAEPTLLKATDFTYDGFTANWQEVGGADQYLLSVFKLTPTEDVDSVVTDEKFDTTNGGEMPSGWQYTNPTNTKPEVFNDADRGITNALLIANGDTITTPDNGGLLISASLDLVAAKNPENLQDADGKIEMQGWDGFRWNNLATIYTVGSMGWGKEVVEHGDISSYVNGKYYKVRFIAHDITDGMKVAIDNVHLATTAPTKREYEFEDKVLTGTSYTLTGLDPEADYYYTVKARNSQTGVTSEGPTQGMDAFGVATPNVKEASDIDNKGAYTANWESAPKATSYSVENYDVYTAPAAEKSYVVLQDSFNKIDGVPETPEAPFAYNNAEMQNLDDLTDRKGWYGYLCGYAQGAIGGIGLPQYRVGGQLQSPELSLGHNGGKYNIKITACGLSAGELLNVYSLKSRKGAAIRLQTQYTTVEASLEGGSDDDILVFETQDGTPFFISDITVTQDLNKGDKVYTLIDEAREEGNSATSHRFSGLKREANHTYAYGVYSIYKRYFDTAWSVRSPRVEVAFDPTGIEDATTTAVEKRETARYTLDGRRVAKDYKGMVIVKYSDGTAVKQLAE